MMQMRHMTHELRVTLDHVLQGGEASVVPQNSQNDAISFLNEPEAEMREIHDISEVRTNAQLLGRLCLVLKSSMQGVLEECRSGALQFGDPTSLV